MRMSLYLFGNRVRRWAVLLINLLVCFKLEAQDAHFSQYYAVPQYLNPALVGLEKDIHFSLNHRSQWRSLGFPQQTSQCSVSIPLTNRNPHKMHYGGIGLALYKDDAGEGSSFQSTGLQTSFAYNIPLA